MTDAIVLDGTEQPDAAVVDVAGGTAFAYSQRDPDKESSNEDTIAIVPYGPGAAVFIVADGAGGLPAGKRASLTAVTTLTESLNASVEKTTLLRTAVLNGLDQANKAVLALGNRSATTMTVVTLEGTTARSYQMGDSEALIVGQRGAVRLQTTPHSPTGFAVEAGFLGPREALHHPERHLVSNFVGWPEMTIDVGAAVRMRPLDTLLLATDGLTDNIYFDEVVEWIRKGPLDQAAEKLTAMSRRRMASPSANLPSKPDDLSFILFRPKRIRRP